MNQEIIQFKKQRELGEILNVTFKFIRQNYKAASRIYIKVVGPVFLVLIAAIAYYTWSTVGSGIFETGLQGSNFIISLAIMILAYMLFVSTMTGTIYHIILSYINNGGEIVSQDVTTGMKADFGKLLLLTLISWILIFAGMVLLFIPGVYLFVPLSLSAAIMVFRRESVLESISSSFDLIKNNWWITFATLICIGLLVYLIGLVFQIPAIIYMFFKAFTVVSEGSSSDVHGLFGTGYIVLNVITSTLQYVIYSITPIAVAFVYFNLNEKQNFTGTYETIQNLGNNK